METRVPREGYLASMIRWDNDTLEDTPGDEPDKLDVIKINPYIDKTPPNTETGVEIFVREMGTPANSIDRQIIKTGTADMMENGMIKTVPPLEYNELLDSGTELRVAGNEVQLDACKLGGPGDRPHK